MIDDESHIFPIATDYTIDIYISHGQNFKEVVKVTTFAALVQCAKFRTKQLFKPIGVQLAVSPEPLAVNGEWHPDISQFSEMLEAVDLHLQANLADGRNLRIGPEQQRVVVALLLDDLIGQKGKHFAESLEDGLIGPALTWTRSMSSL